MSLSGFRVPVRLARCLHYYGRVSDDVKIQSENTRALDVYINKCEDLDILRGAAPRSVTRLSIVAREVRGDIHLGRANHFVDQLSIWVENLEGNILLPKKRSFLLSSDYRQPTSNWLNIYVGKFGTDLHEKCIEVDEELGRLWRERKPKGAEAEDVEVIVGEGEQSVYLGYVGDDVKLLPKYHGAVVSEMNVIAGSVDEIDFRH